MSVELLWTLPWALAPMVLLWLVSLPLKNASIVDIYWGTGFVWIGWTTWYRGAEMSSPKWALLAALTVWGARLTLYLLWRNAGHGEDRRYVALRKKYAPFALQSLWVVFLFQGVIAWVVSLPVQHALLGETYAWQAWHGAGIATFVTGLVFEAAGDWQLARFKGRPENKGQVMDRGLWKYTRHPNYFGDFLVWWGLFLLAMHSWDGAWTIIGPLVMSFLLMRFSGVTLLESDISERRPGYAAYKRRTSVFFPRRPRDA